MGFSGSRLWNAAFPAFTINTCKEMREVSLGEGEVELWYKLNTGLCWSQGNLWSLNSSSELSKLRQGNSICSPSSPLLESLGRIVTLGRTPPFSRVQFWRGTQRWDSAFNTPGKWRNKCLCPEAGVWTGYYIIHYRSQSPIDRILVPGPWKTPLLSKSNETTEAMFAFALLNKTSGLASALYLIMMQNTSFVHPKVKASDV